MQLTELSYKALISVTIFSGTLALLVTAKVRGQLMESEANNSKIHMNCGWL